MLAMAIAGGCSWIGYAADAAGGGHTRDALYVLPNEPTVVVAENWKNPGGSDIDAERVERDVYLNLKDHHAGVQIDPSAVIDLRSRRPDFRDLSVAQIGKLVGAKQVVYVNLTQTSVTGAEGSDSVKGHAAARVKVIDTDSGEATFPTDSADGYPVSISTPLVTAQNSDEQSDVREHLMEATANRVASLFYKTTEQE